MTDAEVEAVARAIFTEDEVVLTLRSRHTWDRILSQERKRYLRLAAAAIAALDTARAAAGMVVVPREPTMATVIAGAQALSRASADDRMAVELATDNERARYKMLLRWRAMIAAATLPAPGAGE